MELWVSLETAGDRRAQGELRTVRKRHLFAE